MAFLSQVRSDCKLIQSVSLQRVIELISLVQLITPIGDLCGIYSFHM